MIDKEKLEKLTALHLERCSLLGVDIRNEENRNTPLRCAKADLEQFTPSAFEFTVFANKGYNQMVVKSHVPFSSLCSHHLYVYQGECSLAYIPDKWICGLSKLARLVAGLSKGAHSQEWLTQNIADYLEEKLKPKGVIVVMKANHTCESVRGVKNNNNSSLFITSAVTGVFRNPKEQARAEFFNLLKIT